VAFLNWESWTGSVVTVRRLQIERKVGGRHRTIEDRGNVDVVNMLESTDGAFLTGNAVVSTC